MPSESESVADILADMLSGGPTDWGAGGTFTNPAQCTTSEYALRISAAHATEIAELNRQIECTVQAMSNLQSEKDAIIAALQAEGVEMLAIAEVANRALIAAEAKRDQPKG